MFAQQALLRLEPLPSPLFDFLMELGEKYRALGDWIHF
jgi:hypothetical protein